MLLIGWRARGRRWGVWLGFLAAGSAIAGAADDFRRSLDVFSGEWEGELQVHAPDGFLLKSFPARRRYYWEGDDQRVVTTFSDGETEHEIRARNFVQLGRLRSTVERSGQPAEEFTGATEANGITWTNGAGNRRDHADHVVRENGVLKLESSSLEVLRATGVSGLVRVDGVFWRKAGSINAADEGGSVAGLQRRIAALEEELTATRKGAAEAAQASRGQVEALIAERDQLLRRNETAGQEAQRLTGRIETLEAASTEAGAASELLKQAESAAAQATERVAAQEANLAAAQGRLSAETSRAAAQISDLRQQLADAGASRDGMAAELAQARREAEALQARTGSNRELASTNASLRSRVAQLENELQDARPPAEAVQQAEDLLAAKARELESVTTARDQAVAQAAELARQVAGLRGDLEKAQADVGDASARMRAQPEETQQLRVRVEQLETEAAAARQARQDAAAVNARLERERAALREAASASQRQMEEVTQERDRLQERNAAADLDAQRLAARIQALEATAMQARNTAELLEQARTGEATATERAKALEAKLREAESRVGDLTGQSSGQIAALRQELADARQQGVARVDELNRQVVILRADLERQRASAGDTVEKNRAQVEEAQRLRARVAELEAAVGASGADRAELERLRDERTQWQERVKAVELSAAEREDWIARLERELTAVNEKAQDAQADSEDADRLRAAIDALKSELAVMSARMEGAAAAQADLAARMARVSQERDDLQGRLQAMAQVAAPAPGPEASTAVRAQRTDDVQRLERRLTELESERNTMRQNQTLLQSQLDQAGKRRDDTLARFQEVVAGLNAMREERDRLARANVSLEAEVRAARGAGAAVVPTGPPAEKAPTFLERLLGPAGTDAANDPARRSTVPGTTEARAVETLIDGFEVIGITHTATEDKVILNGKLFRNGDLVNAEAGLVFVRIDGDALVFGDASGREFRRQF